MIRNNIFRNKNFMPSVTGSDYICKVLQCETIFLSELSFVGKNAAN